MAFYRITEPLPHPAIVMDASDLCPTTGDPGLFGLARYPDVSDRQRPIPWTDLAADLSVEDEVTLYRTERPTEDGVVVECRFPSAHGAWGTTIHELQHMLVVATARDLATYERLGDMFAESWIGRMNLVVRGWADGVGTRPPR